MENFDTSAIVAIVCGAIAVLCAITSIFALIHFNPSAKTLERRRVKWKQQSEKHESEITARAENAPIGH